MSTETLVFLVASYHLNAMQSQRYNEKKAGWFLTGQKKKKKVF